MNKYRSLIAVVLGCLLGGVVNMLIVMQGSLPEGVNLDNLSENMYLLESKHFVVPILGHAIGTLVGALLAALLSIKNKYRNAMMVGLFYLLGGIANVYMLKFPVYPAIIDLAFAYIPMAYLGWKLAGVLKK